ncbi:MAG: CPBP family intramembrane glutamic endopeptidase [Vicinamibacterales bacterium]
MFPADSWTIGVVERLAPIGWAHVVVFGAAVPVAALLSRRRLLAPGTALPPRVQFFRSTALTLVVFGLFSWMTARAHGLDLWQPPRIGAASAVAVALIVYVLAVAFGLPWWRQAVLERRRFVELVMPEGAVERSWWITVSLLAGVSEEITWRGVQTSLLAAWLGSGAWAVVLSAVGFGISHATQGAKSAVVIVAFAVVFQGLVWVTGSLAVAIAVHAAYDLTAGLTYAHLGRRRAYPSGAVASAGSAEAGAVGAGGDDRSPSSSS